MTISIIIPVYNVEKYVRRCLESVIIQESNDYHIECIIVDDCSPDNSMSIIKDVISHYKGTCITFHIIHHEKNMGISSARNSGIAIATGEYIFFIDSDDSILENAISTFISYLKHHPSVDIILGDSLYREHNSKTNAPFGYSPVLIEDKRKIIELVLNRVINRNVWNKLIRRSLITDYAILFDIATLYEDVTWTYKLYSSASSILIIPELTYIYENNPTSLIHTTDQRSNQLIWSLAFVADSCLQQPPIIHGKKEFFAAHLLFVSHWVLLAIDSYLKYGANKDTREKLRSIRLKLLKSAIYHVRPLMVLYFSCLFAPFYHLLKWRTFRSNLYRFSRIVLKFS